MLRTLSERSEFSESVCFSCAKHGTIRESHFDPPIMYRENMDKEKYRVWTEKAMSACMLCPRKCAAPRGAGKTGYCKMTDKIVICRAALHMWEEPCISGTAGSGAVFFAGCNMRCVYCQNYEISRGVSAGAGRAVTPEELAEIFLELQEKGATNINLVTTTHYIPQIAYALCLAKDQGLSIPIVYNTGGYERVESLKELCGLIDVYLPDYKYDSSERAARFSNAPDYPVVIRDALAEMFRQVGRIEFDPDTGLIKKGMIVRHLVLPDTNRDTKRILRYLKEQYGEDIFVSLLHQYTPIRGELAGFPELMETVSDEQYEKCVSFAQKIGMENVYVQDGMSATDLFIPDFNYFSNNKTE